MVSDEVSRFAVPPGPGGRAAPAPGCGVRRDEAGDSRALELLTRASRDRDRRVLLTGGTVVTMDPAIGNLAGDVLVRGNTIADVGADLSAAGDDAIVVDATGMIVLPGLVDSHLHAWEGQLRGLAPAVDLETYMGLTQGKMGPRYRPHDMYAGNLLTALQCLDAGVTTILDNSHNARTPDHSNAAVEALIDSGIRAVHASGAPMSGDDGQQWPADVTRLRDEYEGHRVTIRLYEGTPTVPVWEFARDQGLRVSIEMGEHVTNLGQLHAAGLLTDQHTLNHCFHISNDDWALIADAGAQVNVCPRSDASFGLGLPGEPLGKALSWGIRPGLSMDNEISYGIDMFTEMQVLLLEQRARAFTAARAEQTTTPGHIKPEDALEFATVGGARNCHLQDTVGSLTPGRQADIVLVRTTDLNTFAAAGTPAALVTFANRANVDTVLVAGEVRKWRGRLVGHDLTKIKAIAEASRDHLLAAQRFDPDLLAGHEPNPTTT
ncbi:amidohydrolase family protein [Actinomadura sp. 9N215]|uniref:amidohydrolase family protein n=1 Tax=Actinomadura sp. 9N215 TaxID=3375150 RepID=UPI00378BA729